MKVDNRHKKIGTKRRAQMRYSMLLHRTTHTETSKNSCYEGVKVLVSLEDFIPWFMERDFKGCSVDRIDKNRDYTLDNMQVITLAANIAKDKIKAVDGFCECYGCFETKPLEEFAVDKRRGTGRTTLCRVCDRQRYHDRKARRSAGA